MNHECLQIIFYINKSSLWPQTQIKSNVFVQIIRLKEMTSLVRNSLEAHTSVVNSRHMGGGVCRAM